MFKFLTKHSKVFYIIFGALIGATIIAGCFYMTNYANVHLFYGLGEHGEKIAVYDSAHPMGYSNNFLYMFFAEGKATGYQTDFGAHYAQTVLSFQDGMNSFNSLIIILEVVSLVCFALLLVLANHSRRIFYVSNLVGGVVLPLVIIVLNVVLLITNLGLMGTFNNNYELFNIVSVLQDPKIQADVYQHDLAYAKGFFSCNSITFILFTVLFVIVIVYSALILLHTIIKYKATAEERKNIIEKAVTK